MKVGLLIFDLLFVVGGLAASLLHRANVGALHAPLASPIQEAPDAHRLGGGTCDPFDQISPWSDVRLPAELKHITKRRRRKQP